MRVVVQVWPPPSGNGGVAFASPRRGGHHAAMSAPTANLVERLPPGAVDADALLDIFVEWAFDQGLELYPAQEEAILEILADRHVVLNTPTGSGKSLVALAAHFRAFAQGRRSFYTSPIKALVSEKFFDLCRHFGATNVGMLTGDASINGQAPVVCCTAEVLAAMALSEGEAASVHVAVLDEFHYYGDRERGMAWQLPLLLLPRTTFLLMSATLGDTSAITRSLEERSGRSVALVRSTLRPVPLHFSYSEEPLVEVLPDLVDKAKAPVYVVSFTQRECHDLAQSLTSLNLTGRDEKDALKGELGHFRFDSPYGKDLRRFVQVGIGVHHAGLLPRYRLLVERLAQRGLLKVICGTDTLGVGINVPIRTVLFTRLSKFDGRKTRLLSVRDFKQIAGRAGRKGFDEAGWVVCQAPEHVIENRKIDLKVAADPAKRKKLQKKKPPDQGFVAWDAETFRHLAESPSEPLKSRFRVDHGMLVNLLQRGDATTSRRGGYGALVELIELSHEHAGSKARLRRDAKALFRSLREAGVIEVIPRPGGRRGRTVQVAGELQHDFSIYHTLSLFLMHAIGQLPPADDDYALRVCSLVEAILEDPRALLLRQQDKKRREAYAALKADGVEYDERQERLEKITWPMPDADFIFDTFDAFGRTHPWARTRAPQPKSIARDMYERFATFNEYVREYGLERLEGLLLRHLGQTCKALVQTVPDALKDDSVYGLIGYLRATLQRADNSLTKAWEAMVAGTDEAVVEIEARAIDVTANPKLFAARVRAEMHALVQALARRELDEATVLVRAGDEDDAWTAERFSEALAPFDAVYDRIVFDHRARQPAFTRLDAEGPRQWRVRQVLCDPEGDDLWYLDAVIDLRGEMTPEGPLVTLRDIRS